MDSSKPTLKSTTRTFDTVQGRLTYSELSDLIAPKLLDLLDDIVAGKFSSRSIDEDLIREFHSRVVSDVMPKIAGRWRTKLVQVGNWLPPESHEIPVRMHEYVANLQSRMEHADTVELKLEVLAYAEGEFLSIHPFQDFNGRTIRALLSEIMQRLDLPPADTFVERDTPRFKQYQDALADYDNKRMSALIDFWKGRFDNFQINDE